MAIQWHESDATRRFHANRRAEVDAAIVGLGARQRQLVRLDQIIGAGLSGRAAQHRVRAGRLFRVHDGVFALHAPPYSTHQLYLAAHFACGPDSLVAGFCAAALLSLVDQMPRLPEIVSPHGAGRGRSGIQVRRTRVDPRDRTRRRGIPCTGFARTIVDCAHRAGAEETEAMIMAADSKRVLDRARLEELAGECHGRPGIGHVRAVVTDDPAELRTRNEVRMFRICRRAGVPRPLCNHRIDVGTRTFYADFCWPEARLIVEADSWRWHGGREASENDRDRDQLLSIAGWRVVRFTRDQILHHPEEVARRLCALMAQLVSDG